jgi:flavin reductase (DIM6/NTAB) family NADH-FMN oxidoreductase RutF
MTGRVPSLQHGLPGWGGRFGRQLAGTAWPVGGMPVITVGSGIREVFGALPTAVAVVTTLDDQGVPRGLTCNAVCSVSLEPPLLLVCVGKFSATAPAMHKSGAFVVNFLAGHGAGLSQRFAGRGEHKFDGVRWSGSVPAGGAPVLVDDVVSAAACTTHQVVEAGDHWIFLGEVREVTSAGGLPLVYCRQGYSSWAADGRTVDCQQ